MVSLTAHGYTVLIDPEHGGNCVRLSRFASEALRGPAAPEDMDRAPFFYGTPPLLYPNRISGGRFTFEGREYVLPVREKETGCFIHGDLHRTAFHVIRAEKDRAHLRRRFTSEDRYMTLPHAFTVDMGYHLTLEGLRQTVTVTNDSGLDMPFGLGFHTAFRLPFTPEGEAGKVTMRLDTAAEYPRDQKTYLPDGTVLTDYPDREALARGTFVPAARPVSRLFKMGDDKTMTLTDPGTGVRVTYTAERGYRYWMVFSPSPGFICAEPQSWLTNCPNGPFPREETGFDFIVPGGSRVCETLMSIERI